MKQNFNQNFEMTNSSFYDQYLNKTETEVGWFPVTNKSLIRALKTFLSFKEFYVTMFFFFFFLRYKIFAFHLFKAKIKKNFIFSLYYILSLANYYKIE